MRHPDIEALLEGLELSLLKPSVRRSERAAELLAEGFLEFGSSGRVMDKARVMASLKAESATRVSTSNFAVRLLAPDLVLVTYRAHRHSEPPVHTLRSSLWQRKQGKWQVLFHQGTLVTEKRSIL